MYDCLLYSLNYDEYLKKEAETDEKLREFSETYGTYGEDDDFQLLDEAYIVKLDVDYFELDDTMETGYFLVLIGDIRFDEHKLLDVIYGWSEDYAKYKKFISGDNTSLSEKEAFMMYRMMNSFGFIEARELGEDFVDLMDGNECEFGEIIKKVF